MKYELKIATRLALVLLLMPAFSTYAHHSFFGRFDTGSSMEVEGTVTEIAWHNPHVYLIIESISADGNALSWEIETGSPTILQRAGIPQTSIKLGDYIKVAGYPPLTEANEVFATNILTPNNLELIMVTNAPSHWEATTSGDYSYRFRTEGDPSRPELGIFRIWSHTGVVPFLFPESIDRNFDMNSYPMTTLAKAALAEFDPATDNPTLNCVPKGMPTIMEQPLPMEILRQGEDIIFRIEEYDLYRTIHMTETSAPENEPRSALGYSIGQWQGSELVVTTTKLNWPYFNQSGIPQSMDAILLERFIPSLDGSVLDYELIVTDPVYFTEPVELSRNWLYIPSEEFIPFDCISRR